MKHISPSEAAAVLGSLGGRATGPAKARHDARASASTPRTSLGSRRNPRHYTSMAEAQLFADGIGRQLWCRVGGVTVLVKPTLDTTFVS